MSEINFPVNKLSGLSNALKKVSENEVDAAAKVAEGYARDHVQVLTGATQDSIHTEVNGEEALLVADGAALFLEYGTVHMRAYPFMRPAMDAAEQQIDPSHLKSAFEGEAGV